MSYINEHTPLTDAKHDICTGDIENGSKRDEGYSTSMVNFFLSRRTANESFLDENNTFMSLEEVKSSFLEVCCSGDGVLSGALSLITTAVAPTMLSIPLAFVVGGYLCAACIIVFCIMVNFFSLRIFTMASLSANSYDYETVAAFFLGTKGRWGVRGILFLYNFGSAVVFLCFIRDGIGFILADKATFLPRWARGGIGSALFLMLGMILITPLTFNSRLASLRTKGFISNIFVIFVIFSVVYRYFHPLHPLQDFASAAAKAYSVNETLTQQSGRATNHFMLAVLPYMFSAPIFLFSYEVQSNIMAISRELNDRSGHKIFFSTLLAMLVITLFYTLLGVFGSLSFPNLSVGNILLAYDVSDTLLMVCQALCCFSAAISFCFTLFPCRIAASMFLTSGKVTKIPKALRVKLGVSLSVVATALAILLPDIARAVSIMGALFSTALSMTFPALFAMKMRSTQTYFTGYFDGILNILLLFCGVFFAFIGTIMTISFKYY